MAKKILPYLVKLDVMVSGTLEAVAIKPNVIERVTQL